MNPYPVGWRMTRAKKPILLLVGFGEWGPEDARLFAEEFRETVSPFLGKPWAILGDATGWGINNPYTQREIRTIKRWSKENGCRIESYFVGKSALKRPLHYNLAPQDEKDYHFRAHASRESAVLAVIEAGFKVRPKEIGSFFRGDPGR